MLLRYTTRTFKSRRLDSHQHEAVYGTAALPLCDEGEREAEPATGIDPVAVCVAHRPVTMNSRLGGAAGPAPGFLSHLGASMRSVR